MPRNADQGLRADLGVGRDRMAGNGAVGIGRERLVGGQPGHRGLRSHPPGAAGGRRRRRTQNRSRPVWAWAGDTSLARVRQPALRGGVVGLLHHPLGLPAPRRANDDPDLVERRDRTEAGRVHLPVVQPAAHAEGAQENITLPADMAGHYPNPAWLDQIIDTVDLRSRLGHRPAELSGGQQQRVACARVPPAAQQ